MRQKVLITDPISPKAIDILTRDFDVIDQSQKSPSDWEKLLGQINAWIVRSSTQVTAQRIEQAPALKVIGRAGAGVDNIDIESASLHGVLVMNTPGANTISAAEHVLGLILSVSRHIPQAYYRLKKGLWDRKSLVGRELSGKILGIIGMGRIGTEVARRALAFNMHILAYDPYLSPLKFNDENITLVDLETLLKRSDYVSTHVPKGVDTHHILDGKAIQSMKQGAYLINASRGGVVDEESLRKALESGQLAGAALDVFEKEPIEKDHPLLGLDNLIATPHLGASTFEAQVGVSDLICQQVGNYLKNEMDINHPVNLPFKDLSSYRSLSPYLHLARCLGYTAHGLFPSGVSSLEVIVSSCEIQQVRAISNAILLGFLQKDGGKKINLINAFPLATLKGLFVKESLQSQGKIYRSTISLKLCVHQKEHLLVGSLSQEGQVQLVQLDHFHLKFFMEGNTLILTNDNRPGVVGKVGTILGEAGVNILEFRLALDTHTQTAMAAVNHQEEISKKVLDRLLQEPPISSAHLFHYPPYLKFP